MGHWFLHWAALREGAAWLLRVRYLSIMKCLFHALRKASRGAFNIPIRLWWPRKRLAWVQVVPLLLSWGLSDPSNR